MMHCCRQFRALFAILLLAVYGLPPALELFGCERLDQALSVHIAVMDDGTSAAASAVGAVAEWTELSHGHCHHGHYHPPALAPFTPPSLPRCRSTPAPYLSGSSLFDSLHPEALLRPPRAAV